VQVETAVSTTRAVVGTKFDVPLATRVEEHVSDGLPASAHASTSSRPVSVAAVTTVPGAACTPVVSRVDLAVGPFVGPNQAVLGRIGPITTRPRRYRILPICRYFLARRRHERHASRARGRRFDTHRAHLKRADLRARVGVVVRLRYARDSALSRYRSHGSPRTARERIGRATFRLTRERSPVCAAAPRPLTPDNVAHNIGWTHP
jgi:hypothetical protein